MRPSSTRTELTEVRRGTPMGELLRRYWHPIGLVADATDVPRKVRVLGEDLIQFRDKHDRAGLLHARCYHRGTTLYYGNPALGKGAAVMINSNQAWPARSPSTARR